jgi:DNA-directed RNA polymerase subunit RPC12/RpoP
VIMPDISVGINCPTCGGAISVPEGENIVMCQYCSSTLFVEGDQGVSTIAFKNKAQKDAAVASTQSWWRKGFKARDLRNVGKIVESYPIYLPFWKTTTRVAGWICGYDERRHTDQKGNTTVEKIPKEVMVLQDYVFSEIACDPGDLGIRTMRNLVGETSFADFEMIPTFEATTSKDDAVTRAKNDSLAKARASAHVPHVTFEKLHVFPRVLTMIYYPVWVVRYNYRDRMYMDTVDGVTGQILSGRAPGDPLFQSLAMTGGAVAGGLVAAGGIVYSGASYANDSRIALVGVAVGAVILFLAYRFFRHGSERVEGEFKEKKASVGSALKQVQDLSKQLEGLR